MLTEWYIQNGVAGIFSVCLSSEMFQVMYRTAYCSRPFTKISIVMHLKFYS